MKPELVAIVALAAFWIGMWAEWVFSRPKHEIETELSWQAGVALLLAGIIHLLAASVLIYIFLVGIENTLAK